MLFSCRDIAEASRACGQQEMYLCGLYVNFDDLVTVVDFGRSINIL